MAVKFKIRKGDPVIVVAGRDKGKKGSVLKMLPKENKAIVQGVNVAKRHTKQSAQRRAASCRRRCRSTSPTWRMWILPTTSRPGSDSRCSTTAAACAWPSGRGR
jgi:hypothetical protein